MSSDSFDATLELAPRASVRALSVLMLLHGSVGLLLMLVQPPQWLLLAILGGVLVSWLRVRRHPVFGFGPRALTQFTWHAGGDWTLQDASGARMEAKLAGDSLVLPGLLVLNFRCNDGTRRTRAIVGDELDDDLLSGLRARLKLEAS